MKLARLESPSVTPRQSKVLSWNKAPRVGWRRSGGKQWTQTKGQQRRRRANCLENGGERVCSLSFSPEMERVDHVPKAEMHHTLSSRGWKHKTTVWAVEELSFREALLSNYAPKERKVIGNKWGYIMENRAFIIGAALIKVLSKNFFPLLPRNIRNGISEQPFPNHKSYWLPQPSFFPTKKAFFSPFFC